MGPESEPEARAAPTGRPRASTSTGGGGLRAVWPGRGRRGESGSVSLELVLVIPVLVLMTVFVLWAGRGGRAGLSADLAAEEAATAAALCCEEDTAGAADREALVEDVLAARPGLQFLCVDGLRPAAPPDSGSGPEEFLSERWLRFDPDSGASTGGVGVLGVEFVCESDGAVAPLRGLFPTVTFHGRASEIVLRDPPRPDLGFAQTRFPADEDDVTITFEVRVGTPVTAAVTVDYVVDVDASTAVLNDDYLPLSPANDNRGSVTIPRGSRSATFTVGLVDDDRYEPEEYLVLDLDTGSLTPSDVVQLDNARLRATGVITDDESESHLFVESVAAPCEVSEGGAARFRVRLRDSANTSDAPSAATVTVDVATEDGTAAAGSDYTALSSRLTFDPGDVADTVTVQTLDDTDGEPDETFKVRLADPAGAPLGGTAEASCTILDDEVRVSVADVSADEDDGTITFEVGFDRSPAADIVLEYELVDASGLPTARRAQQGTSPCAAGDDYLDPAAPPAGLAVPPDKFRIPAGRAISDPVELQVTLCDDGVSERSDERFWLGVSVHSGEAVMESDGGAFGTIVDDDTPTITVAVDPVTEGANVEFKVNLTQGGSPPAILAVPVDVDYTIAEASPVSAEQGVDYRAVSGTPLTGTLTFAAGTAAETTLPVESLADYVPDEGDETFEIELSDGDADDGIALAAASATATITDDPPPLVSVSDFTGPEGSRRSFTISLANARNETVSVDFAITGDTATVPGHATDPADFEPVPATAPLTGTIEFFPGFPTSVNAQLSLLHDAIAGEPDETLRLTLSNPDKAALFDRDTTNSVDEPYGVGTITNVDPPELTVDNPGSDPDDPVREGDTMTFTVTLSRGRAGETVTVDYAVVSRSARAGRDFTAVAPGTLTLDADNPAATVDVDTLTDTIAENPETLHLVLSGQTPSHVALANAIGVGTITNVNPAVVRASDPAAVEGADLGFVISLVDDEGQPAVIHQDVTVSYHTADRTATAGTDYNAVASAGAPDSVTFNPGGATTRSVTVTTRTDSIDEDDETMALILGVDPDNDAAVLGDAEGAGTIEDAPPPSISIDDPAVADEGDDVTFTVSLSKATSETVTVDYATGDVTAQAGSDYVQASGRLTFSPGVTARTITVTTTADDVREPEETFRVDLRRPRNAILDDAAGIGRISAPCIDVDDADSAPPTISMQEERAPEGTLRATGWLSLSQPLCDNFSFKMRAVQGTAGSPATAADFATSPFGVTWGGREHPSAVSYMAVFAEDDPNRGGWFGPLDDDLDEDNEYFYLEVNWSGDMPAHYQGLAWARSTVTIVDDDDPPNLRIADASARAGGPLTFDVSLDTASGRTVSVDYRTVDVTADSTDYTGVAAWTTLTFNPGETTKQVTVATAANTPGEADETFRVELSNPVNAGIDDSVAVGTILAGAGPTLTILDASGDEGDTIRFRVELSAPAVSAVTVDYATRELTADEDDDYDAASGTLTFSVGDDEGFIDVTTNTDSVDEADELFLVELSNPSAGVSLADASAVGTINGNVDCVDRRITETEPMPTVSASGTSAREDSGQMTVTITVTKPLCQRHELLFYPSGGTAIRGADWTRPQSVRLAALETSVDFHVPLLDDELVEGDEYFGLVVGTVGSPGLRDLARITLRLTIIDDDVATLELPATGATSTTEGGFLSFAVRLNAPTFEAVTFDYATADGAAPAATAGADYRAATGTATIPAGELAATVAVRTLEDALFEHDENVELRISNPVGAEPDPDGTSAVGRIVDDDDPPAVSVSNASGVEGEALAFEVTLDTAAGRAAALSYSTSDGTATAGRDYTDTTGTLTFAAGETAKTVSVPTLTDTDLEDFEHLFLDLTSTVLRFDDNRGAGTIHDATARRLTISDAVATEGGTLRFAVRFDGPPSSRDITVQYQTAAGTATAGDDYSDAAETTPRTLRILAGRTSAAVEVATLQDSLDENLERLTVMLSSPSAGAELAVSSAVGLIRDDDPEPSLSVDDPEATENGDGTPASFTLSLSEVSGRDVSVRYSTADGTATAGSDYTAVTGATATIAAGALTAVAPVTLVDDEVEENAERFRLELSAPSNARLADSVGVATILDDDAKPQILIDSPAAVFEAAGASVSFPVRLSRADEDAAITVDYATQDATATSGDDYTAATGTLTFAAGETAKTVAVSLVNDDDVEETETFRLTLSNPSSNAILDTAAATATATVLDDDGLPTLSVSDAPTATEGGTSTFTVTLSRASPRAVTVKYASAADPLAGDSAATPGQDFAVVSATLTIAARSTSETVTVSLPDDALDEPTETFWLRLAEPVGATIRDGTGAGAIADNDPLPRLTVGDAGAAEGDRVRFTVRLDAASGRTVSVPWTTEAATTGNPATPVDDFTPGSGTLTIASGTTTARIGVETVEDEVSEPDETFRVRIRRPTNAIIDDGVAVGAINDDDGLPRISIAAAEVVENDSPAVATVTLGRTSSSTVTVDYTTAEGTATNPEDYGPTSGEATGTLTIAAGLDTGEISVFVADDSVAEDSETFQISLSNPSNAVVAEGAGTATVTIVDDDKTRISIADAQAGEGDGTISFPVTLNAAGTEQVTVRYTTFDGSATQPRDYTAASGTLTIAAGDTSATVTVTLTDDTFVEPAESLLVRLSAATGAEIADAQAVGVILDDDTPPVILVGEVDVGEHEGSASLTVSLSHASDREVRVNYLTGLEAGHVCQPPTPFSHVTGTLVFRPGDIAKTVVLPLIDNSQASGNIVVPSCIVRLWLTNPVNGIIPQFRSGGIVRIWDDEEVPYVRLLLSQVGVLESEGPATLTLYMSRANGTDVSIPYRVAEPSVLDPSLSGILVDATAGDDFTAATGTATIPAGQRTTTISVPIVDDTDSEPTEYFGVLLTRDDTKYVIGGSRFALGGILDNDGASLSVDDVEVTEGGGSISFQVVLDRVSSGRVTVQYATSDGTAAQPADYASASGTLTFEPGATEALVEVTLVDDAESESDETFTLTLSGATGATIADSTATATIRDDDGDSSLPVLTVSDLIVPEPAGDSSLGTAAEAFQVAVSKSLSQRVTVDIQAVEAPWLGDRAATAHVDFVSSSKQGYLVERNGVLFQSNFKVDLGRDRIPEHEERFIVWLSNPANVVLANNLVWVTIRDSDLPILSIADATVSEGASAGYVEFALTLHEPGVVPAAVRYTTRTRPSEGDAAAAPGSDYTHTAGVVNFAVGVTSATIRVPVIADTDDELDETFLLELSNPSRLAFARSAAVGTITDDDPGWVIDDRGVTEDAGSMVFTVTRDHTSAAAVTLNYTVTGASAVGGAGCTAGVDYVTPSGSVTLQPAETSTTISLTICDDTVDEGSETLVVELTGVPGRKRSGTGTIRDND